MLLPRLARRAAFACALVLAGMPARAASGSPAAPPPAATPVRLADPPLIRGPDLWSIPMPTLDRRVLFDALRNDLFGGRLTQGQVEGLGAILDACPADLGLDPLAYCIVTTFHETDRTMQPIEEIGRGKGKRYGPSGFYGRGLVQLTWDYNYARATSELRRRGVLRADEDLVRTPALALRPDVACAILFHGMIEGWFTGKKLADFFGPGRSDPIGARRIINGTDRAALIAGYFRVVCAALRAANTPSAGATRPAPTSAVLVAPASTRPADTSSTPRSVDTSIAPPASFWARVHAALSRAPRSV